MARDFKKEYREYHSKPKQVKRRAERNAARRLLVKAGRVKKGDGKEFHCGSCVPCVIYRDARKSRLPRMLEGVKKNEGRRWVLLEKVLPDVSRT